MKCALFVYVHVCGENMTELKSKAYPDFCVCMAMRDASRAITKVYDDALFSSGLKVTQFSILMNVKINGPLNVSALAKLQKLDRTTLVRTLKPLIADELIENIPSDDPRERQVRITDKGMEAIRNGLHRWKAVQKKIAENFSMEQLEMIGNFSNDLAAALGDGDV